MNDDRSPRDSASVLAGSAARSVEAASCDPFAEGLETSLEGGLAP